MKRAILLCILCLGASTPQDPLTWKVKKGQVAEYKVLDGRTKRSTGDTLYIFGSELNEDGSNRIVIDRYADIPLHFLFNLPGKAMRRGGTWKHETYFFRAAAAFESGSMLDFDYGMFRRSAMTVLKATGGYRVDSIKKKKTGTEILIDGTFEFYEVRRDWFDNNSRLTDTKNKKGVLKTSQIIDPERGVLTKGAWVLSLQGEDRVRYNDSRPFDKKKFDSRQLLELDEVVTIDPEKLKPAIDNAVSRGVDWLKRRQGNDGNFGQVTATETRTQINVSPIAMRALFASGAEEGLLKKGTAFLKRINSDKTQEMAQTLIALALSRYHANEKSWSGVEKETPREDLRAIQNLAKSLLAMRHGGTATFPTGSDRQRDDRFNVLSTEHASEALWMASQFGINLEDIWQKQISFFAKNSIEETRQVELDLVFAKNAMPPIDPDGEKKVYPGSWANGQPRYKDVSGQGIALTTTAGLWNLVLAENELRSARKLDDKLKDDIEKVKRAGLAWIQKYLSNRSVVPPEASWCTRVPNWLFRMGRVLDIYGIEKIGGVDWYHEAAYALLRDQFKDGNWDYRRGEGVNDTAYAILFLLRAF